MSKKTLRQAELYLGYRIRTFLRYRDGWLIGIDGLWCHNDWFTASKCLVDKLCRAR